jgi:DNA polymerase-3 subunit gamma/tau
MMTQAFKFQWMENFVVSARKYRPASFDTVVGQAPITTTLKNAIKTQHLAQAFLFCGPRGVGKTTCARILAKTINCSNLSVDTEACNACESCVSFNNSQSLNIYELDAASNNSVEDIRGLVEQVRYAPHGGKYKIYIIDEVHMLSSSAFNAFLKTLEEPPSYAIFILATTEKHKILPTILSRCQIFDFSRIRISDISSQLARIAERENIPAEPAALHVIAQKADGAMRDALSMFDQIVSFSAGNVTYKAAINNLNILDYDYYFKLVDFFLAGDYGQSLMTFNEILAKGFDGHHFVSGLASHLRDLMVAGEQVTISLLDVDESTREKYVSQSRQCSPALLFDSLKFLSDCDQQYRTSKNQRLLVELLLMRICSLAATSPLKDASGGEKKNDPLIHIGVLPAGSQNKSDASAVASAETEIPAEAKGGSEPIELERLPASGIAEVPPPVSPASNAAKVLKPGMIPGIPSLRNKLNADAENKKMQQAEMTAMTAKAEPVTQERLVQACSAYRDKLVQDGKSSIAAIIGKDVRLCEGNKVEYGLSALEASEIKAEKTPFLEYLRNQLQNDSITLDIQIVKSERTAGSALTADEKLEWMRAKNPDLDGFIGQLGLDKDY